MRKIEPSPKKIKNPPESVKPVVKMEEPDAGSKSNFFRVNGMKLPIKPPSDIFMTIAIQTIRARSKRNVVTIAKAAPSEPISKKYIKKLKV